MTVIERLFDNAWYVANASPTARDQLAADVTRAWMEREAVMSDAARACSVAGVSPARSALALSLNNATQAAYDRARSRASLSRPCSSRTNPSVPATHDIPPLSSSRANTSAAAWSVSSARA